MPYSVIKCLISGDRTLIIEESPTATRLQTAQPQMPTPATAHKARLALFPF